jgi:hypothetical protein
LEAAEESAPGGNVGARIDEDRRFESAIRTSHTRGRPEPGKGRDRRVLRGDAALDERLNRVLEMRIGLLEDPLDPGVGRRDAE